MKITYLETREAVNVKGSAARTIKGFLPQTPDSAAWSDWFEFELSGPFVFAYLKGDRTAFTAIPLSNVKSLNFDAPKVDEATPKPKHMK